MISAVLTLVFIIVACPQRDPVSQTGWYTVKTVLDGDTVILSDNRRVRYLGIDTPELGRDGKAGQPFSRKARDINASLVKGVEISLSFEQDRQDRYGRLLAYVSNKQGVVVNLELIRRGVAFYLADASQERTYDREMLAIQRAAMKGRVGMWQNWQEPPVPEDGYVGNRRSRRFHHPDCHEGDKISPHNRQRLASQWRALYEGFAPARGCMAP